MSAIAVPLLSASLAFAGAADCPKGGDYRTTLANLAGACAVAFDGADLIVCVPDAVEGGQLLRISRLDQEAPVVTAYRINVDSVIDVAVAADGTIAVADSAGSIWVGSSAAVSAM